MSDLDNAAGGKVEKTNKHKLISGKTGKDVGESVPGSMKTIYNFRKILG